MKYSLIGFFVCVLFASIMFDDPHLYYYKRVVYIAFVILSIVQLYLFNFKKSPDNDGIPMPPFYKPFINIFIVFVIYNLIVDLFNPAFSIVTLLNHPLAVLSVLPVFAFKIGYQTKHIEKFVKFLFYTSILFCILFIFPIAGKNVNVPALACYYSVLPLFIFSLYLKKYRFFAIVLILLGFIFSEVSESRTIILRTLLFVGLLVSLSVVKKWSILKFIVIAVTAFFIVQFLTNLDFYLELFKEYTGRKNFDDEDTRTFLYQEVFGDLKMHELVLGRGFQGTYFSNYFLWLQTNNNDFTGDHYYRFSVEVGFLQLLLKGGFVYVILYLFLPAATVYKCLFGKHNSKIAFLISAYILTEIFIMFIENIPAYHFQSFIIFFLAGYAYRNATVVNAPVIKNEKLSNENLDNYSFLQPGPLY